MRPVSDTASVLPPAPAPNVELIQAIKTAQKFLDEAKASDPTLVAALTSKALVASKSVYGAAIASGLAWLGTRYGLALTPDVSAAISGGVVLLVSALLRYVTAGPITGIIKKGP